MGKISIQNISCIEDAAREFLRQTQGVTVYAFYGRMGAGKTTFISAVCSVLGVGDEVASPTFTIVNEYRASDGTPVFHFDFYRIEKLSEVLDIGYEEYLDSGGICLMEWPEKIEELLPEDVLRVSIVEEEDGSRTVTF
ncbi:MAG TPA: tRNA (adenosine(37)-N6)-threonylcarbamoyltransferase complex ATPase subunit type 1 TsaE [Candidatus Coprenecus merdigallinarum]|nr:tRNA (adenosine(37)-N6)-threonylcarbamoyltransferase complex ATPase subunit type 1 TsaE [Candidatus Coprenecus merdigallinarum]